MKYIKCILLGMLLPVIGFAQQGFKSSSLLFVGSSVKLNKPAKDSLQAIADRIRDHPESRVVVKGYCSSTKRSGQLSWDRVNIVIIYLVEQEGISANRFFFKYGEPYGDCNMVDVYPAAPDEEGPTTVPAPFPNLRRRN